MQEYLYSENLSTQQKQTLFMLQTRMIEVKANFSERHKNVLTCHFCNEEESQPHLLLCTEITDGIDTSEVQYDDIFRNLEKQVKITKVFDQILKQRDLKLKHLSR